MNSANASKYGSFKRIFSLHEMFIQQNIEPLLLQRDKGEYARRKG